METMSLLKPSIAYEIEDDNDKVKETLLGRLSTMFKVVLVTWLSFYILPLLFLNKCSFWIQRSILFLHFVRWPLRSNLKTPSKYRLTGAHNFYVESTDGVKLGAWHILPSSLVDKIPAENKESFFEQSLLGNNLPIMLYMHGNTGTRATFHRVELYRIFQKLNFHVITFDYRGYGDSSNVLPDEEGVVSDGKSIIRWLMARRNNAPVFVWGHSLGTAISSHALYDLEKDGVEIDGLILECPFNNIKDEIISHPGCRILKYMIGFNYFLVDPFIKNGLSFKTDECIAGTTMNVLILTAEDDWIIPFTLSYKLYKYALKHRSNADQTVKYVQFSSKYRYGHKYICHSHNLTKIIRQFTSGQLDAIDNKAV